MARSPHAHPSSFDRPGRSGCSGSTSGHGPGHALRRLYLLALCFAPFWACTSENNSAADPPDDQGTAAGGQGGAGDAAPGGAPTGGAVADSGVGGATDLGGSGGSSGGSAGDAASPDAAGSEACAAPCARLADCATEVCGEAATGSRAAILEDCAVTCAANPSFEIVAGGIATCGDLVDFGRQSLGETFNTVCDPSELPPEVYPICDIFADRLVTCLTEACPALAEVSAAAMGAYRSYCNGAANNGELNPDELAMYLNAGTPCDTQFIADIVAEQTGEAGDLVGFCADGPATAADTCQAACAAIGPCIEPGADGEELRDPDFCAYICGVSASPAPAVWECLAATGPDQCDAAAQCFALAVVEEPACVVYAARVATCTGETCPAVAAYQPGLAVAVRLYCNQSVQSDAEALAVVRGVTDATRCDDLAIAPLVVGLTTDDPNQEQDGLLAEFCAAMSGSRSPEVCAATCAALSPCVPEDTGGRALRDADYCAFYCGTDQPEVDSDQWACVGAAAADGCEAVLGCFSPPP